MPPPEENAADLKQIRDAVSKISEPLKRSAITEKGSDKLEARFLDDLSESPIGISSFDMEVLARTIGIQNQFHELNSKKDIHKFRKTFLKFLFGLVCAWLLIVIAFVGWNASSPSIDDRIKLITAQSELFKAHGQLNGMYLSQFKTIYPNFCSTLFHLSDAVLITFITSTTVAVLGLFLTAAKWLFGDQQKSRVETESEKPPDSN